MSIAGHVKRYGTRKLIRRVSRAAPVIGTLVAAAGIAAAIRRKGVLGGIVNSALDALPFIGTAKSLAEAGRGRDFIPDRQRTH